MMTGLQKEGVVSAVAEQKVGISLDMNLRLNPEDTYFFDGMNIN